MWISREKIDAYEHQEHVLVERIKELTQELQQAKDLKEVLSSMAKEVTNCVRIVDGCSMNAGINFTAEIIGGSNGNFKMDQVAFYVDDFYGGKVLKQESIRVVSLDKDGNVKYGYTSRNNKKDNFQRNYVLDEVSG